MQQKAAHTLTQQLSHDKADPEFPGHLRQCFVMYNVMMLKTSERIFEGLRDFLSHHPRKGHIKPVNLIWAQCALGKATDLIAI